MVKLCAVMSEARVFLNNSLTRGKSRATSTANHAIYAEHAQYAQHAANASWMLEDAIFARPSRDTDAIKFMIENERQNV
jgi:hypothetical protein